MKKEIKMGHGLYKYVEEKMGLMSGDITSDEDVAVVTGQSYSEIMQDELEPIVHPTQHDESDDLEAAKREEMTEFEKSEYKRKTEKRKLEEADYTDAYWKREFYHLDSSKEEVEWKIVELDGGGFIRRPFPLKKATLAGPDKPEPKLKQSNQDFLDHVEKYYFSEGEKWEHKYDT